MARTILRRNPYVVRNFCHKALERFGIGSLIDYLCGKKKEAKAMSKSKYIRQITAFGDYFKDFKKNQTQQVLRKIYQVFLYIMTVPVIPQKYLKSIEGAPGLFEIRIEEGGNIYRIFCCMDEGNLVILFNAFQKKTQKTPRQEIARAQRIMKQYFDQKEKTI